MATVFAAGLGVESFLSPGDADERRPPCCPHCSLPSRPLGKPLGLHGHGVLRRLVHALVDGRVQDLMLFVRRYLCTRCHKTCTVMPRGVVGRYRYELVVIVHALFSWAIEGQSAGRCRARFGRGPYTGLGTVGRWASLRRWTRGAQRLFGIPPGEQSTLRLRARAVLGGLLGVQSLRADTLEPATVQAALSRIPADVGVVV